VAYASKDGLCYLQEVMVMCRELDSDSGAALGVDFHRARISDADRSERIFSSLTSVTGYELIDLRHRHVAENAPQDRRHATFRHVETTQEDSQ